MPESEGSREVPLKYLVIEAVNNLLSPSPVEQAPSSAVYERREPSSLLRYAVMAVALLLGGMLLCFGELWIQYLGFSVAGFAAPMLYLIWMVRNDRYEKEPLSLVAYTFGWGAFCAIFASMLNEAVFIPLLGASGAAFVEEPLKIIGVYWLAMHRVYEAELNDHLDGMIYGAAVGAGFAGLENFSYIYTMIMRQEGLHLVRHRFPFCCFLESYCVERYSGEKYWAGGGAPGLLEAFRRNSRVGRGDPVTFPLECCGPHRCVVHPSTFQSLINRQDD